MRDLQRTLATLLLAGTALTLPAQQKLDLLSRLYLMQQRNHSLPAYNSRLRDFAPRPSQSSTMAMVEFKDKEALDSLTAQGGKVLKIRGNIAIVTLPLASIEQVAALKTIRRVQLPRKVYQKMNLVREVVGVDKIHQGIDLPQAYTGKGVVTGIVDSGIDPNHVNFLNSDGGTRFGYISRIYQSNTSKTGYVYENYYPRQVLPNVKGDNLFAIEDFTTDSRTSFHGTHTTGIMAGGYKGSLLMAQTAADGATSTNVTADNPYYGCATESELVASCGDLYDQFIAFGVDDIISYAEQSGSSRKPCVVNLSLGSNLGAHDSTSLMNRYLGECGKDAIICVAAGNEADYPVALTKTFAAEDTMVQTFLRPMQEGAFTTASHTYYNLRNGSLYVYSGDSTMFTLQAVIFNAKRHRVVARFPLDYNSDGQLISWSTGGDYAIDGAQSNTIFSKMFQGYIALASAKDTETGRYYAIADFLTTDDQQNNADGDYRIGIVVTGHDGQRIDVYGDAQFDYFDNYDEAGWTKGSRNGTINDMACAPNVISVGCYNIRDHWPSIDGYVYGYNNSEFPVGQISRFSSFGTLMDGRNLPDVCAPGSSVISSTNTYCVENASMGYTDAALQAKATLNGKTYYWQQTLGTSMSTPVVAGSIALWLQANPDLTYDDVIRIIRKTAIVDADVQQGDSVQWGAGKFDAYAGLKEVLNGLAAGVRGITADDTPKPVVTLSGWRTFRVLLAGAKQINLRVYNLSGQCLMSTDKLGEEATVDASGWQDGIYLLQVNGQPAQRIAIY